MKLQYSQKRNLENEKCFEIKSVGTEQNKNMISFLRKDANPIMSTFNLGKIQLELQPSVTNEMVQLSKAFLARKGSSDESESPSPSISGSEAKSSLRIGVDIHSFHIRLVGTFVFSKIDVLICFRLGMITITLSCKLKVSNYIKKETVGF